tara:strand:- start:23 stop:1108 length:1086 start_codon:yes stop_codon:yes gene_type:complete
MKKINLINRFLLFCSGTSLEVVRKCPSFEIIKYSTIGFTIFLTSILALVSSFFALSLIFDEQIIVFCGSVFWMLIIFNLDRYIVMTLRPSESLVNNFIIMLPRFVIALLVAIVISKPIEIKLFEKEISNYEILNKTLDIADIEQKLQSDIVEIELRKNSIIKNYEVKNENVEEFYKEYICECAGTCGTMIRGRGIECQTRKIKYENELNLLVKESSIKDSLLINLANYEKKIIDEFENQKKIVRNSSFGFFDKLKALNSVNFVASSFILLIFIMIEIAPILTKILSRNGPYDTLIKRYEIEFETEFFKSTDFLNLMREKKEKIDKISSEIDFEQTKNFVEKVSRSDAFDRYEKLRNSIDED